MAIIQRTCNKHMALASGDPLPTGRRVMPLFCHVRGAPLPQHPGVETPSRHTAWRHSVGWGRGGAARGRGCAQGKAGIADGGGGGGDQIAPPPGKPQAGGRDKGHPLVRFGEGGELSPNTMFSYEKRWKNMGHSNLSDVKCRNKNRKRRQENHINKQHKDPCVDACDIGFSWKQHLAF